MNPNSNLKKTSDITEKQILPKTNSEHLGQIDNKFAHINPNNLPIIQPEEINEGIQERFSFTEGFLEKKNLSSIENISEDALENLSLEMLTGGLCTTPGKKTETEACHAEQFEILKSLLDGNDPSKKEIQQLIDYAKAVKKTDSQKVDTLSAEYADKIKKLNEGESQLLYTDFEGFSQICRFTKQKDGTLTIDLYTPVEFSITTKVIVGDKLRRQYHFVYENVPTEMIYDHFVRSLIERNRSYSGKTTKENQEINLLDNLMGKPTKSFISKADHFLIPFSEMEGKGLRKACAPVDGVITGPRAQAPIASMIKAFLRGGHKQSTGYKRSIFKVKVDLLHAFHQKFASSIRNNDIKGKERRRLLTYAAHNISRSVTKFAKESLSPQEKKQVIDFCEQVLKEVEEAKIEIKNDRKQSISDLQNVDIKGQEELKQKFFNESLYTINPNPVKIKIPLTPTLLKEPLNAKSCIQRSEEILKKYNIEKLDLNDQLSLNIEIASLIDQLPIPVFSMEKGSLSERLQKMEFWKGLSLEEKQKVVKNLSQLVSLYICKEGINRNPAFKQDELVRFYKTGLSLLVQVHYLACMIDKEKHNDKTNLLDYSLTSFTSCLSSYDDLIYFDSKQFEEISKLQSYLKEMSSQEEIFAYQREMNLLKNEKIKNASYWKKLLEQDPTLAKKAKENFLRMQVCANFGKQQELHLNIEDDEIQQIAGLELDSFTWSTNKTIYNTPSLLDEHGHGHILALRKAISHLRPSLVNYTNTKECTGADLKNNGTIETNLPSALGHHELQGRTSAYTRTKEIFSTQHRDYFHNVVGVNASQSLPLSPSKNLDEKDLGILESKVLTMHFSDLNEHKRLKELDEKNQQIMTRLSDKENVSLRSRKIKFEARKKFLRQIFRTSFAPKTHASQLISDFKNEMEHLEDPNMQTLFFRLFFRPQKIEGKETLGVGAELINNSLLREQSLDFIKDGISRCLMLIREPLNPNDSCEKIQELEKRREKALAKLRFFWELSFYISKYLRDGELEELAAEFDKTQEIEQWIKDTGSTCSPREAAVMHQCRLLFYTLKPIESLKENEIIQIYESIGIYRRSEDGKEWNSPEVSFLCNSFILKLASHVQNNIKNEELTNKLCNATAGLNLNNWKNSSLHSSIIENGSYSVDLSTGIVFKEGFREIYGCSYPTWENEPFFKKIFGTQRFHYRALGKDCYQFDHPQWGSFKITQVNRDYALCCRFKNDDRWHRYIPKPEKIKFESYQGGSALLWNDYLCWKPENANSDVKAYFTRLGTHTRSFQGHKNGTIEIVNDKDGEIKNTNIFLGYVPETNSHIGEFERTDCIHLVYNESREIKQWKFPRFVSTERTPLIFNVIKKEDKEELVWSSNVGYTLSPKTTLGYFGDIKGYLQLDPKNEKEPLKLIVPFQTIHDSAFDNKIPPMKIAENETGAYQYFVFDVIGNEPVALTLEGKLFHAYLCYTQKNYAQAVSLLRSIMAVENISPTGQRILEMIRQQQLVEDHPDAKMVIFQSLLVQFREDRKYFKKTEINLDHDMQKIPGWLQSISDISYDTRLDLEEELFFINEVMTRLGHDSSITEKLERRLEFLENLQKEKSKRSNALKRDVQKIIPPTNTFVKDDHYPFSDNYPLIDPEWIRFSFSGPGKIIENYKKNVYQQSSLVEDEDAFLGNLKLIQGVLNIALGTDEQRIKEEIFKVSGWLSLRGTHEENKANDLSLLLCILYNPKKFTHLKSQNLSQEGEIKNLKENEIKKFVEALTKAFTETKKEIQNERSKRLKTPSKKLPETNLDEKYSIKTENSFDLQENQLRDFGKEKTSLNVELPTKQKKRWNTLQKWKENYLSDWKQKSSEEINKDFSQIPPVIVQEDLKLLGGGKPLENDFNTWIKDYDEGTKQNLKERKPSITRENAKSLLEELVGNESQKTQGMRERIRSKIQERKKELLHLANKKHTDDWTSLSERAKLQGNTQAPVTFADCVECLLSMDYRSYNAKNSNLSKQDAEDLLKMTLEIEQLQSYQAQLNRLADHAQKIIAIDEKINETKIKVLIDKMHSKRESLCRLMLADIEAQYYFDNLESQFEKELWFQQSEDKQLALDLHVILHVFCGESGIIPHKKQVALIVQMLQEVKNAKTMEEKKKIRDRTIQLIMGGGKTSVIATLITFYLAQRDDSLSIFIVPASLFASVKINLGRSLWKAFKKQLQPLDFDVQELNKTENILEVQQRLTRAMEKKEPVIVTAKTLQCLQLEFCRLMEKRYGPESASIIQSPDDINKMKTLARILIMLKQKGHGLMDEVDMMLDALQEVNFPLGDPEPVKQEIQHLLHHIFSIFIDKNVNVGDKSIVEVMGLERNKQELLKDSYKKDVIPVVAEQLILKSEEIKTFVNEKHKESFKRFVTGKMPAQIQIFADMKDLPNTYEFDNRKDFYENLQQVEEDVKFLQDLRAWRLDNGHENGYSKKTVADLIAWTRHLLTVVTPTTLSKSGNEYYGLDTRPGSDKIIRYLGVGIPGTTKFGYFLEEMCYYYQYVLAFGITPDALLRYAKKQQALAVEESSNQVIDLNKTKVYKEFVQFFGSDFTSIQEPSKLKEVFETLSKDKQKILDFEKKIVETNVGVITRRLASNGLNMVEQLFVKLSQSGTPWNVEGFIKSLLDGLIRDVGTLGTILSKMIERAKTTPIHIIEPPKKMATFLDNLYKDHKHPQEIRSVIDAAGFFKDFPGGNAEVAKEYLEWLNNNKQNELVDPGIKAVLFFDKEEGGTEYNTLYAYKMDGDKSVKVKIGGTTADDLKAAGLTIEEVVVYFDQYHTTGVDIPLPHNAIAAMTFSASTTLRGMSQAGMRMRQFAAGQKLEFVTTKEDEAYFKSMFFGDNSENKNLEIKHLICAAWHAEFSKKVHEMVRYYDQQINGIFKDAALDSLYEEVLKVTENEETVKELYLNSRPDIVTEASYEGYDSHARLALEMDCKKMLQDKLSRKFKNRGHPKHLLNKVNELALHIKDAKCLPEKWEVTTALEDKNFENKDEMNVEFFAETLQETQNQNEQNSQTETETEMQTQINTMNDVCQRGYQSNDTEIKLNKPKLLELIEESRKEKPRIYSLQEKLHDSAYESSLYYTNTYTQIKEITQSKRSDFSDVFSAPIYGTDNYFYRKERPQPISKGNLAGSRYEINLSLFHKTQKPAKQILVVKTEDNTFRWILLTEKEAGDSYSYLKEAYEDKNNPLENVWLIGPDGTLLLDHDNLEPFALNDPLIQKGLLEINLLLGRASYLAARPELTEEFLKEHNERKMECLALTTFATKAHAGGEQKNEWEIGLGLREAFRKNKGKLEKNKRKQPDGLFIPNNAVEAKLLDQPHKIKYLDPAYIRYLGIDPNGKDSTTLLAIDTLKKKFSNKWIEKAEEITKKQFENLWNHQHQYLSKDQEQWSLKIPNVAQMKKKNKIQGLQKLEEEKLKQLEIEKQKQIEIEKQKQIEIEKQKQIEIEKQKQIEIEKQKQIEIEKQKQIEIEKQKQIEIEKQKQIEIEKQKQIEIEKQKQIEIEKQKQIEIEKQKLIEVEKQKQIEIEKENISFEDQMNSLFNNLKDEKISSENDNTHRKKKIKIEGGINKSFREEEINLEKDNKLKDEIHSLFNSLKEEKINSEKENNIQEEQIEIEEEQIEIEEEQIEIEEEVKKKKNKPIRTRQEINCLNSEELKKLTNEKEIRLVSSWNVYHLNRTQLSKRTPLQVAVYTLSVTSLGLLGSAFAAGAHLTVTPLTYIFQTERTWTIYNDFLHALPKRLGRHYYQYIFEKANKRI